MSVAIYVHCPVCDKPIKVEPSVANAEVTHGKCAMEAAKDIRERDPSDPFGNGHGVY